MPSGRVELRPVVLDIITDSDIEDMKTPLHHRELRLKKIERWTTPVVKQYLDLIPLDS